MVSAEEIATLVVAKLQDHVIPASLPAGIGEWIAKEAKGGNRFYQHVLPGADGSAIFPKWIMNPDGTLNLELADVNQQIFWRGTFRPVAHGQG